MSAFAIADFTVTDPDLMKAYAEKAGPTLGAFGGQARVIGGDFEVVEGDWKPSRIVVLEFPSMEKLKGWYNSPEYQEILPMRLKASHGAFVFVEGA